MGPVFIELDNKLINLSSVRYIEGDDETRIRFKTNNYVELDTPFEKTKDLINACQKEMKPAFKEEIKDIRDKINALWFADGMPGAVAAKEDYFSRT